MKTFRGLAAVALLAAGLTTPARADYSKLVVFGDSLSDTGNLYAFSGGAGPFADDGLFPTPPYFAGRITNGAVWVEHLAQGLGLQASPALLGGTNFAWAGAQATGSNAYYPGIPDLDTQVNMFLGGSPAIDGQELAVLWAGANDFLLGGQIDPTIPAAAVAAAVGKLADAGITSFLVPNLPALGGLPVAAAQGPAVQAGLNALTDGYNLTLDALLQDLATTRSLTIDRLDVHGLFADTIANPASYGLTDVANPSYVAGVGWLGDPSDHLFFDTFHPTAHIHAILGGAAIRAVPEPSAAALCGLGLLASGGFALASRRRAA